MCLGIAVPLILLVSLNQQASVCLYTYINTQVLKSIYFVQTVDSRWYLIQRCMFELIPAFILCAISVFIYKKQNLDIKLNWNKAFPFILVAASAVFPMMISLKQRGFYILPSFPIFALGIGILIYPVVNFLILQIKTHSLSFKVFTIFSLLTFIMGLFLSMSNVHTVSRDVEMLHDIHIIGNYLDDGSTIGISKNLWTDWNLHGYFSRYKSISLDSSTGQLTTYLLTEKNNMPDTLNFRKLDIETMKFNLYQKR